MRFAMHLCRRLRTGCTAEAEYLARTLIEPILVIFDTVLALLLDILDVRLGDVFRGCAADLMNVHIYRHDVYPALENG
jgi:hypothetical protein